MVSIKIFVIEYYEQYVLYHLINTNHQNCMLISDLRLSFHIRLQDKSYNTYLKIQMLPFSAILLTDSKLVATLGMYKTSLPVTLLRFPSMETSIPTMPTLFSCALFATEVT